MGLFRADNSSSAGGALYFSDDYYIKFKGLGVVSNNSVELLALKLLMKCALDRNISRIPIYGD
jgi:hypothetical protein